MKSKLLCIAPYSFNPPKNGGQKCILEQYRAISKYYDMFVVSTNGNENMSQENYSFYPILGSNKSKKRYYDTTVFNKVLALIKSNQINSLLIDHPYMAGLAYRLHKKTKIKVNIRSHNIEYQRFKDLNKPFWPLLKVYERWAYRMAESVIYITEEDRDWAESHWNTKNSQMLHYGTWRTCSRLNKEFLDSQKNVFLRHNLASDTKLVLFNGALDYPPNVSALKDIIHKIAPETAIDSNIQFLICGNGLSTELLKEINNSTNITFAGFVPNIDEYLLATDIFLNPIMSGGGIKTKLVEAIATGIQSVSYKTGAAGISTQYTGEKLVLVPDGDYTSVADFVLGYKKKIIPTPEVFYDNFNWYVQASRLSL